MADEPKLPERLPNEPNKWYDRLQIFVLLGSSRSVYAAYLAWREISGRATARESARKRAGLPQSWRLAAERWEWVQRAEKFDENERTQQLTEWQRRRDELREQEWKFSQELLEKVKQMLVFPLAKTVRSLQNDEQIQVTEIYPTRWSIGDVARFAEAASKLGRLAVGEETERVAHQVEVSSDALARARQRAKEWETEMYGE